MITTPTHGNERPDKASVSQARNEESKNHV